MKIAVLVFGEYRTFETAVKTWNCRFWDDVDYYMSTWNSSIEPPIRNRHIIDSVWETKVDEEYIKGALPNVNLKISNSDSDDYTKNHETNKMIYHWKTLYQMVVDSGKSYDAIFLVRPDVYFFVQQELFEISKKNNLYVHTQPIDNGVHDIFFFGYGDIVLDFLKDLPKSMNNIHTELKKYIDDKFKNRIDWFKEYNDNLVLFYDLIRPTSELSYISLNERPLEKDDYNPNFIQDDFIESLKYTRAKYDPGFFKILLIGESCNDKFVYGDVNRLSPEAPIPIINPIKETTNSGMAGNVKRQIEELWSSPHFITNESKITKTRYVDNSTNYILLRVDSGDENVKRINLDNLPDESFDAIVFSDYNKGLLEPNDIEFIIEYYNKKLKNKNLLTFIDTKKQFGHWLKNINFIKINFKEYQSNLDFIKNNSWLKEKLIVTRGPHGCDYNGENYPTNEVPIKDLSGAGDTFLSSLVCKYIVTENIQSSIEYANRISEMAVQRKGVSLIEKGEILNEFKIL